MKRKHLGNEQVIPFWKQTEVTNFRKTIFLHFFRVSLQGECKIEIKIENRIKIGLKHFKLCFCFQLKMSILTNLGGKITNFKSLLISE